MQEIADQLVPDAKANQISNLIEIAKKHDILRLSAEEGMDEYQAIKVIESYSGLLDEHSLPEESYSLLD